MYSEYYSAEEIFEEVKEAGIATYGSYRDTAISAFVIAEMATSRILGKNPFKIDSVPRYSIEFLNAVKRVAKKMWSKTKDMVFEDADEMRIFLEK